MNGFSQVGRFRKMLNEVGVRENNRKFKQLRRRPQRQLQKKTKQNNRFNDQNNSSARASRFLIHFFHVHCTSTTRFLWRTWTYDDEFSFIFFNLNKILKNTTPGKVACIWASNITNFPHRFCVYK